MFKYRDYGIYLESDFEIRKVYEDDRDLDLFISLNKRPVDLDLEGLPSYIKDRIQMPNVGNILIRLSKGGDNNLSTIHFLENIDLNSSIINFVIDYEDIKISILAGDFKNSLKLGKVY